MTARWHETAPGVWTLKEGGAELARIEMIATPAAYHKWHYAWTAGTASGTADMRSDAQRAARKALAAERGRADAAERHAAELGQALVLCIAAAGVSDE